MADQPPRPARISALEDCTIAREDVQTAHRSDLGFVESERQLKL